MTKVLVTGAAGFIGYHAAARLLAEGNLVVGLDNLNPYYDVTLKEARLALLKNNKGFAFYRIDLADREAVTEMFARERPALVLHLGAQAGVRYSLQNPQVYVDSNITGTLNVLECCRSTGVSHLVFASSSSVYGASARAPFAVGDRVDRPESFYAVSKLTNELTGYTYSKLYGLPVTGLRFFTVYGPWGRPDMAYYLFTGSILAGRQLPVFNGGKLSRDFTYIDDAVEGLWRLVHRPPDGEVPYRLYNIGNHRPVGLLRFIEILEDCLGRKAKLEMLPMQPGDVPDTFADVEDLAREVGFRPDTPLEMGLQKFVEWYRMYHRC
jgi:UDP-glucuronate 4-epimerase